jgi:arginase
LSHIRRILVPYHLDERLGDLDLSTTIDATIVAELPDGEHPWKRMAYLYDEVAEAVADSLQRGLRPVVQSGDCTTSLGVVAGSQRAGVDPAIVWLDAHGDVQTPETTASGYLGGMPLRLLVGYRPELIANSLGLRPVGEEDVLLVDARDLDPPEAAYLAGAAIRRCRVNELATVPLPERPVYLHVDADVVDPVDLPGLVFPAPSGPRLSEVVSAVRRLVDRAEIVAVTLACTWHPGHGAAERFREVEAAVTAV